MNRVALKLLLIGVLGCPVLVGCDRTVSEETTVQKKPDGTVVTDKEKTTQSPDGSRTHTTEHKVDK